MTTSTATRETARQLAGLAPRVRKLAGGIARRIESKSGLTPVQSSALVVVGQGARRVNEVAEQTLQHQSGASRVVDALVEMGHVDRQIDPEDRRATILQLTPSGKKLMKTVVETEISAAEDILSQMDVESARLIAPVLTAYLDASDITL